MKCLRCGRRVGAQESGLEEMEEALAIWRVKVRGDGRIETSRKQECSERANGEQTDGGEAVGKHASGREARGGEVTDGKGYEREARGGEVTDGKGYEREAASVDPHIALTSSDKSPNLVCGHCLHVLLPVLFPTTPQPERVTIGLEDIRLARFIPAIFGTLGGYPGHIEVEHLGEDVLVRRHMVGGGSEAYTVGRSGDLVRVPGQRPVGGSKAKEIQP